MYLRSGDAGFSGIAVFILDCCGAGFSGIAVFYIFLGQAAATPFFIFPLAAAAAGAYTKMEDSERVIFMQVLERFLKYIAAETTSDPESTASPSAGRELDLAKALFEELKALGALDVVLSDTGYVYAKLPATPGLEDAPALGFIAHMDTSPDFPGAPVHPQVHKQYDGKAVALGAGLTLSPEEFPHLKDCVGKTLITTDGTTLLGADDKAGIAEILTACERILSQNIPHGPLCIAFTPDEEIGRGTEHFDLAGFGAKFAYTVDGGDPAVFSYENFNACDATLTIHGKNIHPGSAKDKMHNAARIAMEADSMLPAGEVPEHTQGREGFFHLTNMQGDVTCAVLHYILRDHDALHFDIRKEMLLHIAALLNEKYGEGTAEVQFAAGYRNMEEYVRPYPELIERAKAAIAAVGLTPAVEPIRGGTDGATLSARGLPCPNLGTGGWACHGPYEHITEEDMELCVRILLELVRMFAA